MRQLPLPVRLRASSVFDSYYNGPNDGAVRQLLGVTPHIRPIAVWLYGPSSAGKTHLAQALCAHMGRQKLLAAYLPLGELGGMPAEILAGCETLSLVCLDDWEAIGGRPDWERAIFRLHTLLEDHGGRLMITAIAPPATSTIELRDLASRLGAGTVIKLQSLNDDDQAAALALRASRLGLALPPDTAQYLLRRLPRDMTALCAALDKLDGASLASQRRLTVPFVKGVLGDG
jgi:DnaA-homolog protein